MPILCTCGKGVRVTTTAEEAVPRRRPLVRARLPADQADPLASAALRAPTLSLRDPAQRLPRVVHRRAFAHTVGVYLETVQAKSKRAADDRLADRLVRTPALCRRPACCQSPTPTTRCCPVRPASGASSTSGWSIPASRHHYGANRIVCPANGSRHATRCAQFRTANPKRRNSAIGNASAGPRQGHPTVYVGVRPSLATIRFEKILQK
jgi:hypothetical protein